jgi:hypothetical protein
MELISESHASLRYAIGVVLYIHCIGSYRLNAGYTLIAGLIEH